MFFKGRAKLAIACALFAACGGISQRTVGDSGAAGEGAVVPVDEPPRGAGGGGATVGTGGGVAAGRPGVGAGGSLPTDAGVNVTNDANGEGDPFCRGIKIGMPCAYEGLACSQLVCGLADEGRRDCICATNWSCTACDYSGANPLFPPASELPMCTGEEADGVPCAVEGAVCSGAPGGEACACFIDSEGAQVWDCAKPPYDGW